RHRGYAVDGIRSCIEEVGLNKPELVERYGKVTVHTFRHTFASRLVQAGVPLYHVQALLGHTSPQMTQRYAHLRVDKASTEAAAVLVPAFVSAVAASLLMARRARLLDAGDWEAFRFLGRRWPS
ncbi:MAG: tyrosine-type recombinase/integrase, partial [Planctomycetota bacterium]